MCAIALAEDLSAENPIDITAALIPADKRATATLISRDNGILCGTQWVEEVFRQLGEEVKVDWKAGDGDKIIAGDTLCILNGDARTILTGERSAMNFLQSLSATATLTAQYVELLNNSNCRLLDTRKTIPGMRFGQKYAVSCGGGQNHRIGLSDAYLIKENHILACGGIALALQTAANAYPDKLLEIEVESLAELKQALDGDAQVIMLDNFSLEAMNKAVTIRDIHRNPAKLEASGNVSLQTLPSIAATGVDFISVGALTKNITALDLSLRVIVEN